MKWFKTLLATLLPGLYLTESFDSKAFSTYSFNRNGDGMPLATAAEKMLTIILIVAGLICFWLFFRAIEFFDKI